MTQGSPLNRSECETIVRRMWPYLDGTLPDGERERVVTHLAECATCQSHFDYAQEFLRAVAVTRRPTDEGRLRTLVLACLADAGFQQG